MRSRATFLVMCSDTESKISAATPGVGHYRQQVCFELVLMRHQIFVASTGTQDFCNLKCFKKFGASAVAAPKKKNLVPHHLFQTSTKYTDVELIDFSVLYRYQLLRT